MSNHNPVLFIVVGLLLAATVLGTSGSTQIEGSRDIQIRIADGDVQPYLGVEVHSPRLPAGHHETVPLLTLRHTLKQNTALRITATVTVVETGRKTPTVTADPRPRVVGVGEAATLSAPIRCDDGESHDRTFTLRVSARGTNVAMDLTEQITITCTGTSSGSSLTSTETTSSTP